jgi:uncharacterized protein
MNSAKSLAIAFLSGLIFAAGLAIGGMMDPAKVRGFLDVFGIPSGRWDPSLAFVMGGALIVAFVAFRKDWLPTKPWAAESFEFPTTKHIDARLIVGAVMFGMGWGLAGYCPGPAIASGLVGGAPIAIFLAAMLVGMWIAKRVASK